MTTFIDLRLYASLQDFAPPDASHYPIEKGMTLTALVDRLGIARENPKLFFINGVRAEIDTVLQGGERVAIFPPIGGG